RAGGAGARLRAGGTRRLPADDGRGERAHRRADPPPARRARLPGRRLRAVPDPARAALAARGHAERRPAEDALAGARAGAAPEAAAGGRADGGAHAGERGARQGDGARRGRAGGGRLVRPHHGDLQPAVRDGPRRADGHVPPGRVRGAGRAGGAVPGSGERLMESQILLQLLNGLVVGSSLALVASGLALLFGVLHVINFAQGDFFMLGAYSVWLLLRLTNNYALSLVVGTLLVGILGGLLLSLVVWPLLQRSQVWTLLATLGLSLIIQQVATNVLGGDAKLVDPPLAASLSLGPVSYPLYFLLVVVVGMGVLLAGAFALKTTKYGIWLRAVAQNRPMAAALGVPVPRVFVLAFVVCAGLAALAGGLLVPLTAVYPTVGADVILYAFIVVVAGGMGNLRGAALIAILVGEVQSLGSLVAKPSVVTIALFALVIVILMVRARQQNVMVRL